MFCKRKESMKFINDVAQVETKRRQKKTLLTMQTSALKQLLTSWDCSSERAERKLMVLDSTQNCLIFSFSKDNENGFNGESGF